MCTSLAKCFLVIFNLIFLLVGLALAGGAAYINWASDDIKDYLEVLSFAEDVNDVNTDDNIIQIAIYVAIGVGALIAIISFSGCCGALCGSSCMLNLYCFFCVILLLGEIAVAVLAVVFKDKIESTLEEELEKQVKEMVTNASDTLTQAWDTIQRELDCCGATGPEDYSQNPYFDEVQPVPESCCATDDNGKRHNETICYMEALQYRVDPTEMSTSSPRNMDNAYIHHEGCHTALFDWFDSKVLFFIIGGFVVAFVQVTGIVLACCVKRDISDKK